MDYINRVARPYFPWLLTGIAFLAGCGESTPPLSVTQETVKLDPEQAFAAALKRAEAGDADAQYQVARMYHQSKGVAKDASKAVVWFQKSAAQGHAKAQYRLGLMYAKGEGVVKDPSKAVEWFQKSAAQGHAKAQFGLGLMYAKGEGVAKDASKAVEWFQKSAAQGVPEAQAALGVMYVEGEGVAKDVSKAVEWFQKSAAQGNAKAQYRLGWMYAEGVGVPKDASKAVEWFQKSAAQGFAWAQYALGRMYAEGRGVARDMVLAYAWFNLSAARGNEDSSQARQLIESELPLKELAEAQRLSSGWRKGQILVREGEAATGPSMPSWPGTLSKQSAGTAFIVSKAGHAVTTYHLINGCKEIRAEGQDGVVRLITSDPVNDLALLQLPGGVSAAATIHSDPARLRQGEDIVVFGFPLSTVLSSGGNLTLGVVSALTGLGNNTNQIQITAPIQPGSSGSPVLNKKGEVVGVVSMKLSDKAMANATGSLGQNVNFAISGQTLKAFLDTHKVDYRKRGFLSFDKSTADLADEAKKWTKVVECWK